MAYGLIENSMVKNYLLTAWRTMKRNRVNSVINIAGLSIGMACVVFIVLFVRDELSYDRFFTKADHIFQVNMTVTDNGITNTTGGNTAPAVTPTMMSMFPEIESYTRVYRPGDMLVRNEAGAGAERFFTERRLMAVDSNFLQIFDYPFLEGDAKNCLQKPDAIVLTEETAKRYFGNQNAIGKILLLDINRKPFVVSGVLKNIPSNSTFQFDMLAPIRAYGEVKKRSWNWFWLQVNSYVKLKPQVSVDPSSIATLESKFPAMVREHTFNKNYGQSFDEFVKKGGGLGYSLLPFPKVHLYAGPLKVPARLTTVSDIKYIYIFSAIAGFIILLACVNFMNLSTAQASKRAREVGIRKVLGSERKQLIRQFLAEAVLYSLIATLLSLVLVLVFMPSFNAISGKTLLFSDVFKTPVAPMIGGLCILTGLLAGLYPAFYLTSFNPVKVLKGSAMLAGHTGNGWIRNGLVVFQFSVSIILMVCTLVVFQQLRFTQHLNLGFNKDNIIEIANTKRLGTNEAAFRQQLTNLNGVVDASVSGSIPTKGNFGDGYVPEATEKDKPLLNDIGLSSFMVDEHFVPTMGMAMKSGRNFSEAYNDSASVILNETAAKQIGWKEPVGKYLEYPGNSQKFKVIGVVKDFHIASLHELIEPFALFHNSSKTYYVNSSYISVRLRPGDVNAGLKNIETIWKQFAPATPFDFSFLDEEFDTLYRADQRMGYVFGVFTALSIFVACLGLFGLSIFIAERRKKEIGVRKVLGASVSNVVSLLAKNFVMLVLLASVIAFPIAWWAMNQWLQAFAYRITMGWVVFAVSIVGAVMIALITISFQSFRAARANPVHSLRAD